MGLGAHPTHSFAVVAPGALATGEVSDGRRATRAARIVGSRPTPLIPHLGLVPQRVLGLGQNFKVLAAIVELVLVHVVDMFRGSKGSTELLSHHKPVLGDVVRSRVGHWMTRSPHEPVPVLDVAAALPLTMRAATHRPALGRLTRVGRPRTGTGAEHTPDYLAQPTLDVLPARRAWVHHAMRIAPMALYMNVRQP
jgi:hypothetical protein